LAKVSLRAYSFNAKAGKPIPDSVPSIPMKDNRDTTLDPDKVLALK